MILLFIDYLRSLGYKVPYVFEYYTSRMILALLTSLAITIFFGPFFIRKLYALKIGQPIRKDECPLLWALHEKKENTPTMGGVLILFSMLVSLFLWMNLEHIFTLIFLATTLFLGFLGGKDDYLKLKYKNSKGLSARRKLFFQFCFCALISTYLFSNPVQEFFSSKTVFQSPVIKEQVQTTSKQSQESVKSLTVKEYASRIYMPFVKGPVWTAKTVFGMVFIGFFIFLVITGSSNAVNLTDGLDGLAAGSIIIAASSLGIVAFVSNHLEIAKYLNILYIEGSGEIAIYLFAMVGACLGFLWYNGYPAQVFMGDTGSLALGGIIGVSAVLLRKEFLLAVIGGIFVLEALSVIFQVLSYRFRNKKRIFLCSPLHHHFEYKGWAETKVVIRFWIVAFLFAIIGIASLKFQ